MTNNNQHTVPQFLQKGFAINDKKTEVNSYKNSEFKFNENISIKSNCSSSNYYQVKETNYDRYNNDIEDKSSKIINYIRNNHISSLESLVDPNNNHVIKGLSNETQNINFYRKTLVELIYNLSLRNYHYQSSIISFIEEKMNYREDKDRLINKFNLTNDFFSTIKNNFIESTKLNFLDSLNISNMFNSIELSNSTYINIIYNKNLNFILGDNMVIFLNKKMKQVYFFEKQKYILLPISNNQMIFIINNKKKYNAKKLKKFILNNNSLINLYSSLIANKSFIYKNRPNNFELLKINISKKNLYNILIDFDKKSYVIKNNKIKEVFFNFLYLLSPNYLEDRLLELYSNNLKEKLYCFRN